MLFVEYLQNVLHPSPNLSNDSTSMMSFVKKRADVLALLALLSITFSACDTTGLEDALEGFNVVVELEDINTSGALLLQDAVTKELITTPLSVSFIGEYSDAVIDMYSDPFSTAEINGGVLNFGLDNSVVPTPSNPITLTVTLSASGYVTKTHRITFDASGNKGFYVNMMAQDNPPNGVDIYKKTTATTTNGVAEDSLVLATAYEDEGASITFPSNTQYLNEDGTPAIGSIDAAIRSYDMNAVTALEQLDQRLFDEVGDSAVVILSAIDVELQDANGRPINSIATNQNSKELNQKSGGEYILNFILNATSYNELQRVLRLAYISPTTAERFLIYSVPEITQLSNGRVELRYLLNSDVFRTAALVYFSEQPCNANLSINLNGQTQQKVLRISDQGFYRSIDLAAGKTNIPLRNITRGLKNVEVDLGYMIYREVIDLCGSSNPTITLPEPEASLIDATVNVTLQCQDPSEKLRITDIPAATVLYRNRNAQAGTAWRVARNLSFDYSADEQAVLGGSADLYNVIVDDRYDFKFSYDNKVEDGSVVIGGNNFEYVHTTSSSACS